MICLLRQRNTISCSSRDLRILIFILASLYCLPISNGGTTLKELVDFSEWHFSNSSLRNLPIDKERRNYVRTVRNAIFSEVAPTPLRTNVQLALLSREALEDCMDVSYDSAILSDEFRDFASGNEIRNISLAHRYGGHQFGSWASQLGDGRAHLLGEYVNKRDQKVELQLKGSGRTPYSRRGDGRAVLRSSLREFLCSEAMHALGVSTSRAISLVVSDDPVLRDPLYNGNVVSEKAAVVLRSAPSWFRFGSFEILSKNNEIELLAELLDFVIEDNFQSVITPGSTSRYLDFFNLVRNQTINMLAEWMTYGFAHGVCNTDNFSIFSITIDYGPFGFVDTYDPDFVPNVSDDTGMYSLERQPTVTLFNLGKLFEALKPVLTGHQQVEVKRLLSSFEQNYRSALLKKFRKKFGLLGEQADDYMLAASFLKIMQDAKADYTMTFRELSSLEFQNIKTCTISSKLWALNELKQHKYFKNWLIAYQERILLNINDTDTDRLKRMRAANPRYVLRNWMAESAIRKAENGDFTEAWKLHMILKHPFEEHPSAEDSGYANKPPEWSRSLKVSCSS